jgi:DNA invertase Pin-like site-specific DNA recombinase
MAILRDHQAQGIAIAKTKGTVYKGRKPSLTPVQASQLRERAKNGEKKTALAAEYGISRETLYTHLRAS